MLGQSSSPSTMPLFKGGLMPQEEMIETGRRLQKLVIGIPKESMPSEYRVPLTPEAVEILVNLGHEVYIEKGAGEHSNYHDLQYSEKGAFIVQEKAEVLNTDIILKVAPLHTSEINHLKGRQLIISSLLTNIQSDDYFRMLMEKKVTAFAFENIKDETGIYPILQSMSAISGYVAITIAAEYLSKARNGKGVMLGGIPGITPTEVMVMGTGTAAENAIRAALGMGATVMVFDNSVQRLRMLQERLGVGLHTSIYHPKVVLKCLKSADVVIGASEDHEFYQYLITEEMVKTMKKGAVIVDIAMDKGGTVETSECLSHDDPVVVKHGVVHYCVPNLPARVPRTASIALSNVLLPLLQMMGEMGGLRNLLLADRGVRHGVYIYNGILTNPALGNMFNIPSQDIDLLMAAL